MTERIIDSELTLIPYYPNYEVTFEWYQDRELCRQVDNIDHTYSMELLEQMYTYLDRNGACFYIQYRGTLVGDITLQNCGEISIVVSKPYQNLHIGRRCVGEILRLAEEKGLEKVTANIYDFNTQSCKMFRSVGFLPDEQAEWYFYRFANNFR